MSALEKTIARLTEMAVAGESSFKRGVIVDAINFLRALHVIETASPPVPGFAERLRREGVHIRSLNVDYRQEGSVDVRLEFTTRNLGLVEELLELARGLPKYHL